MSQEKLKEILDYNKQTGVFTWKNPIGFKTKIGDMAGNKTKIGYVYIRYNKKLYASHRLVWLYVYGKNPTGVIDHINGIKNDNRIENLRDVSQLENARNTKVAHSNNKSSGVLGVSWDKNKWVSRIRLRDKRIQIGRFTNLEDAKKAYLLEKNKRDNYD